MWEHSLFVLYCIVLKMKYKLTLAFLLMMMGWMGLWMSGIGRGVGVSLNRYKQPITHTGGTQRLPPLSTVHDQRILQPTSDYLRHAGCAHMKAATAKAERPSLNVSEKVPFQMASWRLCRATTSEYGMRVKATYSHRGVTQIRCTARGSVSRRCACIPSDTAGAIDRQPSDE